MNNPDIDTHPTLESVQQRFESWRTRRTKREPIPQPLWEAAAGLCRHYSVSHVCQQLRLSFTELKKRIPIPRPAPVQFVDLGLDAGPGGPWHMECERPDGTRLRISRMGQPPSIEPLLSRFLP
jgi:hypothetical protein